MYVELTCKSNFSFLRGASDAREYVQKASELGHPAIGVCDINGVYALPRAYEALRDFAPHLKLICGAELKMTDHPPIVLIAKSRRGWGLLCRLLTCLHAKGKKGEGSLHLDELQNHIQQFEMAARDLICLTQNSDVDTRIPDLQRLKNLFGNRLYLSLCRYLDGHDGKRTQQTLHLSSKFQLPIVATNSVHYHEPLRRPLQDCLTCIREGTTLDQAGFLLFGNAERYLKSAMQMQILFSDLPEAITNTVRIAQSCTFCLSELKYTYPQEAVPTGHTATSYLRELVFAGAKEKYRGHLRPSVDQQIRKELAFFAKRKEEDYFLTLHDILKEAREKKIVFQGRGSAASSVVCYALGITAVDPVASQLLFERFANDARKDPPDIDVDFEHERREEVIQGIYAKYGRDRAGMVAAVHTYQSAGAFRELCKALGVNVGHRKAEDVRAHFQELAGVYARRGILLPSLCEQIANFPRHLGTHTGGFVITHDPLIETVPIEPAAMENRTIVQWDKHDLETLGMMKVDILSIGFLTAIRKATNLIGMDWQDIPINDAQTYELICAAKTAGCFQIESRAQMSSLPHTQPKTPYEMTIQVALIRPSMSKGGMSRAYLKGRRDAQQGRPFRSGLPAMDQILQRTHGVAMFPDQIMQIAMDVCGWSAEQADQLRRSLGKERSAQSVETQGEKLYHAMRAKGVSKNLATDIMKRTQGFASYGFPEAHAASYGSLAFKSAYLKTHYPAQFLCALINSQPMGFYSIDFLIHEAERNSGVTIRPLHPMHSDWDAKLEGEKILRMGFRNVRNISKSQVDAMLIERARKPFTSVEDFLARTNFERDVYEALAQANAFTCFGLDRRHTFWKVLESKTFLQQKDKQQLSLFDENLQLEPDLDRFAKTSDLEAAIIDYKTLGYSLSGNLMKYLRQEIPDLPKLNSATLRNCKSGEQVTCAGILMVDQRPPAAKGFGFLTLEDEFGTFDLILNPMVYDACKPIFRSSRFLFIQGRVQKTKTQITIQIENLKSFSHRPQPRSHQPHPRMMNRISWQG